MTNLAESLANRLFKRPTTPLYLLCVGLFASCLLAAALVLTLVERHQSQWTNEYGQALANLAAHRALDSTLNHDLVSLQVILSDVDENDAVVNATIHDVENNLLVQSGSRNNYKPSQQLASFAAPITLHNSIAGYVTITLDLNSHSPLTKNLLWLFTLLAASLMAMTLCYAYFVRSKQTELVLNQRTIPIVETPLSVNESPDDENTFYDTPQEQHHVQLIICLSNYQELSKQLNSKSFRGINQRLEQQLIGVLALYSGDIAYFEQHFAHIQITSNESAADATFKGICAALLLQKLNQIPTSIPLQLGCFLCEDSNTRSILKQLPYYLSAQEDYKQLLLQHGENKVLTQNILLEEPSLNARLSTQGLADDDDVTEVLAVQENYQSLLEKQLQQLLNAQ